MNRQRIFHTWRNVFGNWKYLLLAILIAVFFYSFNAVIGNWKALSSFYGSLGFIDSIKFFFILLLNFGETIKFSSFVSLIILSFLFGIFVSLLIYRVKTVKIGSGNSGILGSIGIFFGVLAPGCAACGVGLLSVLGLSAAFLSFLPFGGLELSILVIGIMSFSILKISNNMYTCNIPLRKTNRKLKENQRFPFLSLFSTKQVKGGKNE